MNGVRHVSVTWLSLQYCWQDTWLVECEMAANGQQGLCSYPSLSGEHLTITSAVPVCVQAGQLLGQCAKEELSSLLLAVGVGTVSHTGNRLGGANT